ncbi:MAG TPA: SMP-30/gluconolactonase/LRE family protein [Gemmatimonadales bacterium]|nr:SMP-30/gluconolactonase/LRE family protein [Gemmatimonadales bacterium]
MHRSIAITTVVAFALACRPAATPAADPRQASMSILTTIGTDSTSAIEGLALFNGRLFVADWKDGSIYRVDPANPAPEKVGQLPTRPGTAILGAVADSVGDLFFAQPDSGIIYRVAVGRLGARDFDPHKDVSIFATGVQHANGITFDARGHLWITGGDVDALYEVGPAGGRARVFAKDFSPISTDTTMPVRGYVVNGVAFDTKGNVYTLNTGTGTITRMEVKPNYTPGAATVLVQDPRLLGADGLIADRNDDLWVSCNYLSRLVRVDPAGTLTIAASRAAADGSTPTVGTGTPTALRFPAELKRAGRTIYLSNLNFPYGANAKDHVAGASIAAVRLPTGM